MWAIRTVFSATMFFFAVSSAHAELVVMTSGDFGSATTVTFSQFDKRLFSTPSGPLQVGEFCGVVLHRIAAVRGAVNGLLDEVIAEHLESHVAQPGLSDAERAAGAAELLAVIRRYGK